MRYIRNHIVEYQLIVLMLYLVLISITSSMKITLPIYIVLSILPFLRCFKKLQLIPFVVISISLVYVIFGLVFQDRTETLVSFLSKTYQFVIFMGSISYVKKYDVDGIKNPIRLMKICIAFETVMGVYLLINSSFVDISGLARITSGRQPVGGNFSIVMIPLIFYSYYHNPEIRNKLIALSSGLALWVFLSGTRGYMLLFFLALAPMYFDYFFSLDRRDRNRMIIVVLVVMIVVFACAYAVVNNPNLMDRISVVLRLESGTGSRSSENRIALDFFNNTSLRYQLFGIGYGGRPATAPGYVEAVSANVTGSWSYSNYVDRVGVSYHNLFSNYLLLQGVVGCLVVIMVFFWGLSKIKHTSVVCSSERKCIFMFWIGFFIMNCFRWSCDCGISEMIMFAIVLGLMNQSPKTDDRKDYKETNGPRGSRGVYQ